MKEKKEVLNEDKKDNNKDKENNKAKSNFKQNLFFILIPIIISIYIYIINNNPEFLKISKKIEELESKIENIDENSERKKINVAFVNSYLYLNGIARYITVLSSLLVKTGKYNVYIITEQSTDYDFEFNKKVKRIVMKRDFQAIKDCDEENDIQIYILSNDLSDYIDIYHSFGKKVIGIFHGTYLQSIFSNNTDNYQIWGNFQKYDTFIHIIPDDYYIYKKLGFNNTIFIPNPYTFEPRKTPSSPLIYKNLLMVGVLDNKIKGAKFGIKAMAKILKEVPDAKLTILGLNPSQDLLDLIKELKIEDSVLLPGFSTNITEFYLNASVLLVTSVTESFPMVMNEGKAHGLPIVAFNIDYSPCFQSGVIKVNMFDYTSMAKEVIKLLKDYEYRKIKGKEAKLSLNNYIDNDGTIDMWNKLFNSLINGTEEFKKFQKEVKNKYYNEELAKEHLKKFFNYGLEFNKYFRCHTFENLTNLNYIKNIQVC